MNKHRKKHVSHEAPPAMTRLNQLSKHVRQLDDKTRLSIINMSEFGFTIKAIKDKTGLHTDVIKSIVQDGLPVFRKCEKKTCPGCGGRIVVTPCVTCFATHGLASALSHV